ncbi:AbrB/MazE/SpoVT family DNA-binding domain-containing protein [Gorillibacterium sp. sgz500922]|uniref:AbrB/MazE/SpoVT family DNA-binding domain-containing protein n=1 Tax=Gorillibacterium sp. sgz500922 TaxID=3446694 RepID=UPI003F66F561
MKNTGMVRNLDSLGRIVIPTEIRMTRNIEIGDPLEFFITDDYTIVMRKYKSTECAFCRRLDTVSYYHEQFICADCLEELKKGNATAIHSPAPVRREPELAGRKRGKTSEMLERLKQAFQDHPGASQKDLAAMLGISQARISQLKKELKL